MPNKGVVRAWLRVLFIENNCAKFYATFGDLSTKITALLFLLKDFIMSKLAELQAETREIIEDLLNDGSDPNALYIIEHHIAHHDFDLLEKLRLMRLKRAMKFPKRKNLKMMTVNQFSVLTSSVK